MTEGPTPVSSRYRLLLKLASGGMGTVYLGQQSGAAGFQRLVAIKRAHAHLLDDAESVRMFVSEAGLASSVRHPHVVGVIDVVDDAGELLLVLDYVEGGSLSQLAGGSGKLPVPIAVRILLDAAEGLNAVHSARSDEGEPLGLVHRDVSPQNILVGVDGVARVADFGIAKATRSSFTASGLVRGKPGYLAPEYVMGARPTPAMDVFSLGIVAWEMLTGRRLFKGANDIETIERVRSFEVPAPSSLEPAVQPALDDVVLRALSRDPEERFASASELVRALRLATRVSSPSLGAVVDIVASHQEVGALVTEVLGPRLAARRDLLRRQSTPEAIHVPAHVAAPEVPTRREQPTPRSDRTEPSVVLPVRPADPAFGARAWSRTFALGGAFAALLSLASFGTWWAVAEGPTHAVRAEEVPAPSAASSSPVENAAVEQRPAAAPSIAPFAEVAVAPRAPAGDRATALRGSPAKPRAVSIVSAKGGVATSPEARAAPSSTATGPRPAEAPATLLSAPPLVAPGNPYGS